MDRQFVILSAEPAIPELIASKKQEPSKAKISIINATSSIGETKSDT
jgi:hypothetical protein